MQSPNSCSHVRDYQLPITQLSWIQFCCLAFTSTCTYRHIPIHRHAYAGNKNKISLKNRRERNKPIQHRLYLGNCVLTYNLIIPFAPKSVCCGLLSITKMKHCQKQLGEKGFISSDSLQSIKNRNQDRNLEARIEAEP